MGSNLRLALFYIPALILCVWSIWKWGQVSESRGLLIDQLPVGEYKVLKKSCLVGGIEFDYSTDEWKTKMPSGGLSTLALYDDLQERLMIIGPKTMSEILFSEKCKLLVERTITNNSRGIFTLGGSYKAQYIPPNCHFTYTVGEEVFVDDHDESVIALTTENVEEYEVFQYDDDKFHLYDKKFKNYSRLGCRENDKLITSIQLKL